MQTLLFLFGSSFVVGLSGAVMPGPVLTATISETLKRGFSAGPLIVLGHGLLEIVLISILVLGLAQWLEQEAVLAVLLLVGGCILVLMGAHMALTADQAVREALAAGEHAVPAVRGPVLAGIFTSLSNPYWSVWWATIGLGYVAIAWESGIPGVICFYTGHILSDLVWFSFVALMVSAGRRLVPPRVYRVVITLCGLALVALGALFAGRGLGLITG